MKKLSLSLLIFCSLNFWAQESKSSSDDEIYSYKSVEEKPTFIAGNDKFQEILKEKFLKSGITLNKKSNNKVFAVFTIEKDGSLTDVSVASKIKLKKENDIIAIFETLPTWKPGLIKNKMVRVHHSYELTDILKK
jgi:protein TonB